MAKKIGKKLPIAFAPPRPAPPIVTGKPVASTFRSPFAVGSLEAEPFTRPRLDEDGGDDE